MRNMKRVGVQDKVAMQISGRKTRSVFDRYNVIDEGEAVLVRSSRSISSSARKRMQRGSKESSETSV